MVKLFALQVEVNISLNIFFLYIWHSSILQAQTNKKPYLDNFGLYFTTLGVITDIGSIYRSHTTRVLRVK